MVISSLNLKKLKGKAPETFKRLGICNYYLGIYVEMVVICVHVKLNHTTQDYITLHTTSYMINYSQSTVGYKVEK